MNTGSQWKTELSNSGYEHHASMGVVRRLSRFSRLWRRIFSVLPKTLRTQKGMVFEVGCGGGIHLAQFALNGYQCAGIDVSPEVLERARNFFSEIGSVTGKSLANELINGDFLTYNLDGHFGKYDLVFHAGVIEHFLGQETRLLFLKRMFDLCKPGGFVVSIVPSGMHPWRNMMKQQRLGGYNIPEIDYTDKIMNKEFCDLGAKEIIIFPHNLGGYLLLKQDPLYKLLYYCAQIIPINYIPQTIAFRHSSTIIGVAQKYLSL